MVKFTPSKNRKKYADYIWGLGLEHEMHIFHKPKKNVCDFILYDSETARDRLLNDIRKKKIKIIEEDDDVIDKMKIDDILTKEEKDLWYNESNKYLYKNHTKKQKEQIKKIKSKIRKLQKDNKHEKVINKDDYKYIISVPYETGKM